MTNLEYYQDEIKHLIKEKSFSTVSCAIKYGFEKFSIIHIDKYANTPCDFVDWLLSEHKEPIKLKQWEKDLLECYVNFNIIYLNSDFIKELQSKGYFKGITDPSMRLKYILDNCEIVD